MLACADRGTSPDRLPTIIRLKFLATCVVLGLLVGPPPAAAAPNPTIDHPLRLPAPVNGPATRSPPATSAAPATHVAGGSAIAGAAGSPVAPAPSTSDPNAQATSLAGQGPLVANGLGSPSCASSQRLAGLSATARANCEASGLTAAPAPIDNYQFDIHIDTGIGAGLRNEFATLVQDFLLTPLWMALVWATDVVLVAIEWCYSINLLGGGTLGPIAGGLDSMHRSLTTPWLATVLAIAAVTFVYRGLIRRRVVETLGQFALMAAMMIGGLWVIVDPADTVGAVSQLANQASLGVLAASATGDPSQPTRSLTDSLDQVFATAIGTPWCYLEFGNVGWCDDPRQFDPHLRFTAIAIAAIDYRSAGPPVTPQVRAEALAIARARTNGALFLALPANGPGRNSINVNAVKPSLLGVICGSVLATACTAPTAAEAQFRTEQGTLARIGGLLLIAVGDLGMLGFLGFVALRLLSAALLAVLYLLLAPLAVLAPALGDGGRAVFRLWCLRLVGSVLAKLVYSVFLGVVLLVLRVLGEFGSLGWWTQWLLTASFWWIVFNHRHQLLEHVIHERGESSHRASLGSRLFAAQQAIRLARPVTTGIGRLAKTAEDAGRRGPGTTIERVGRDPRGYDHGRDLVEQASRTLERDHGHAVATVAAAPAREAELSSLRERRDLLRRKQHDAGPGGDRRRQVSLRRRADDIDTAIKVGEQELAGARTTVRRGQENTRQTGLVHDADQRMRQAKLLDREAEIRPLIASARDKRQGRRDYAELAPLAGLSRSQYAAATGTQRRRAQLEIDRALERRRDWTQKTRRHEREQAIAAWRQKTPSTDRPRQAKEAPVSSRRRQFDATVDRPRDPPSARAPAPRPIPGPRPPSASRPTSGAGPTSASGPTSAARPTSGSRATPGPRPTPPGRRVS